MQLVPMYNAFHHKSWCSSFTDALLILLADLHTVENQSEPLATVHLLLPDDNASAYKLQAIPEKSAWYDYINKSLACPLISPITCSVYATGLMNHYGEKNCVHGWYYVCYTCMHNSAFLFINWVVYLELCHACSLRWGLWIPQLKLHEPSCKHDSVNLLDIRIKWRTETFPCRSTPPLITS